ncbi:MAG TPA: universal stress protein UspA [Microscillaceae bacterium]|nr:universal stress protein UspA [Microscillaceae bacterium]
MKKILVPVDFSSCANNAFAVAKQMAKQLGAELITIHIVEPIRSYTAVADGMYIDAAVEQKYIEYLTNNAQEHLQKLVNEHKNGVSISTFIEIGNFYQILKETIEKHGIDLVVMGTTGATGIDEALVGSNAQKVVRFSACPVLTLKSNHVSFDLKNIVFATSLRDDQLEALAKIQVLQQAFQATLHLLYVNTPSDFMPTRKILQLKEELIRKANLTNYQFTIYNEVLEELGITNFSEDINADLIAIATHQRKGIAHLLSGSIAEDVVNHADKPVLTLVAKHSETEKVK